MSVKVVFSVRDLRMPPRARRRRRASSASCSTCATASTWTRSRSAGSSWHGRGIYGPTRYACGNHRGELKALLREEYGMLGWHPWAKGPHPWAGRRGTDRARRLKRTLVAGLGR